MTKNKIPLLKNRINRSFYNDGILTMDIIVNNKVDAMIGMDDITPYDFMG